MVLSFLLFAGGLAGQQAPTANNQAKPPKRIGERDKAAENKLASSFDAIRVRANLPRLTRIKNRPSLEQVVCTIAQVDDVGKRRSWQESAIYKTTFPDVLRDEFTKVALFDDSHYPRYSVAVWRVNNFGTGEVFYWVGVWRYWSALEEFVDYHFTDDVFYHDLWKENVAPVCRNNWSW